MARARAAILARGGAARCNVFTRISLALFGQVPWRAVPVMPVELMLLPRWFPFHLDKVSYWSRVLIVPFTILMAHKPRARNPRGIGIAELFVTPPEHERRYITNPTGSNWGRALLAFDRILRLAEPFFPRRTRQRAIRQAVAFITERLNGEDGLGAILPPMAATVMVFDTLGYPKDHPDLVIAKRAVRKLVADDGDFAYFQPCLSPVWDTVLACHALMESGRHRRDTDRPARARLDRRAPDPRRRRRLGQGAARAASRRLAVRVPERPLSRRRRHRSDPVRAAPRRPGALSAMRSSEASNGCSACSAATAAGARSTPTTPTTI